MTEDERAAQRRRVARSVSGLRDARGWSRKQLAEASGLSYPYVSQIENGDREPSIKALAALAGALGVDIGRLASGGDAWTGPPPPVAAASATPPGRAFGNPGYGGPVEPSGSGAPTGRRSSRPRDLEAAVAQAHRALTLLTPEQRLEAVTRLVALVVPEVVEEQVRERGR